MIVAFVLAEREWSTDPSAGTLQKLRFELGFQKLVCSPRLPVEARVLHRIRFCEQNRQDPNQSLT